MSKRKISDYYYSKKRFKSNVKLSDVMLPLELICDIFDLSSFEVKKNFKMVNHTFNKYYQNYMKRLKPKKYVLYSRERRPKFYEFHDILVGKEKKYIRFLKDQKKIRREMKFTKEGIPYCREPTNEVINIYMIDREEMDYVEKSFCDRCKVFTYCNLRRFWWLDSCYLENCLIKEEEYKRIIGSRLVNTTYYDIHNHNLCDKCNICKP